MQKLQGAASNAASLFGQQSLGSAYTPTPSAMAPPSIFARTLPRASAPSGASGLTDEEEQEAQRLGLGGPELTPPGLRQVKAYSLQRQIHAVKVGL